MDLLRDLAGCVTDTDFYRVQIPAENTMTPLEVEAFAAQADAMPAAARPWILRQRHLVRRVHPEPEPYRRRRLADHVTLYEGEGDPGAPRDLILVMAGAGMRPMMPIAPVLQALPASGCDVLLAADPGMAGFLHGVPGFAADPVAVVARLAGELPLAGYRSVRAFGTSSGGPAALCYGALLGGAVALSLGGAHPAAMGLRLAEAEIDRGIFDRLHAGLTCSRTRLACVFGADNARDAVRGGLHSFAVPGSRTIAVAGVHHHGVIQGLFLKDALRRFFADLLLSDTPWPEPVWRP